MTFIHNFPGQVKTNLARSGDGAAIFILRVVSKVIGPLISSYMPNEECGECHVFLATSAKYPAGTNGSTSSGVPLASGVAVARGTNGISGSGVYSVDWEGESSGPQVEELLAKFKKEGLVEKVWEDTEEFKRITGLVAA